MSKRVDTKNPLLFVSRLDHSLSLSYYTKCSLWAHFAYEKNPAALGRPRLDTRRPATKSLAWKPPAHSCSLAVTISCGKRSMRRFSESWKSRTKRKSRTGYLLCLFFFTVHGLRCRCRCNLWACSDSSLALRTKSSISPSNSVGISFSNS